MNEQNDPKKDDSLARLLRSAGRGAIPSSEARARIYEAVRTRWRDTVEAAPDVPSRPRGIGRRFAPARRLLLAASLAAVAILAYRIQSPPDGAALSFARVAKSEGSVEVRRDDGVRRLGAGTSLFVGDTLTTGVNGRVALRLGNGHWLRINSSSEVSIAAADGVALRSGTVYFDSNRVTSAEPLDIDTAFGSVRHVGTQFETSLVDFGLRIRVREGEVVFSDRSRDAVARAGEQIRVSPDGEMQRSTIAPDDPAWLWVEDLATLDPADRYPLPEVLSWVARETGRSVRFADASTEARAQAVVLYELEGLTPRETLEVIGSTTELDYRYTDGAVLLTSADR